MIDAARASRLSTLLAWIVPVSGPPVEAWRRRILAATLLGLIVFGLLAYVPSVWLALQQGEQAVVVLDTVAYAAIVATFLARRIDYRWRAAVVVLFTGLLGVFFLARFGFFAAGFPWLLAFPILATVLLGLRPGLWLLLASAGVLVGLGSLVASGTGLPWLALMPATGAPPMVLWTVSTLSVLMLAALSTISIGLIVDGLGTEATARAEAEQERTRLAAAVDQSDGLVLLLDLDGDVQYRNARARELDDAQLDAELRRHAPIVRTGQPWAGTIEWRTGDGTRRTLSGTLSPVRDDAGRVGFMLGTLRDISRERELEQRLQAGQKLEAVGTLAGGIAHDFNNLLQPIVLNTEAAQAALAADHVAQPLLADVRQAAEHARTLVRRILTFTRDAAHERHPVDLAVIVRDTERLLRTTAPASVRIRALLEPSVIVRAEAGELQQVLLNLATNAVHAMPQGGTLSLRVERSAVATWPALADAFPSASTVALLTVADTGAGMSAETLARAFDPFFSTKGPRGGTGLGLAMVHGTITALGGIVLPESVPGRGTTMRIALPLSAGAPVTTTTPTSAPTIGRRRRVLLIDDDTAVLTATARLLERLGCDVDRYADPQVAVAQARLDAVPWDCVITDLTMPGLDGLAVADAIHARHPALPIVLATGYLEDDAAARFARPSLRLVLTKPYASADLQQALDALVPA